VPGSACCGAEREPEKVTIAAKARSREASSVTADPGKVGLRLATACEEVAPTEAEEEMSFDDRALLTLHVERKLGFRDIAYVLRGAALDPSSAAREEARLRKRFQVLEARLRRLALERGRGTD
jgi:hypothetical protein